MAWVLPSHLQICLCLRKRQVLANRRARKCERIAALRSGLPSPLNLGGGATKSPNREDLATLLVEELEQHWDGLYSASVALKVRGYDLRRWLTIVHVNHHPAGTPACPGTEPNPILPDGRAPVGDSA